MQTTTFTAYALNQILKSNNRGMQTAGYTLNPTHWAASRLNGLFEYSKEMPRGQFVGFKG